MLAGFKRSQAFKKEIKVWVDDKIITEEQAHLLAQRYELDKDAPWYYQSNFILGGVATVLVLMGFILIISYNWDELPIWGRMLSGLVPLFFSYGMAFYFLNRLQKDAAELAMFAGSVLFGINIFLQAQIFNLSSYYPDGFLWWLIGALPAAIYLRSHLLGVVLQVIYLTWLILQLQNIQFSWLSPVFMAGFLYLLYKKPSWLAVVLHFVVIFYFLGNISTYFEPRPYDNRWFDASYRIFSLSYLSSYGLLFLLLLGKIGHDYNEKFRNRFTNLISFGIITFFFIYTFRESINAWGFMISPYIFYIVALMILIPNFNKIVPEVKFSAIIVLLILSVKLLFYISFPENAEGVRPPNALDWQIFVSVLMNILFFTFCIGSIYIGITIRNKGLFMQGIFWLLVLALARYLDLFNDYLTSAVIFILCGLAIYFVNYLWNKNYATR